MTFISTTLRIAALTAVVFAAAMARAEMSAEELAKLAQNPVGNLISVPFQGAGAADVPEVTLRIPE